MKRLIVLTIALFALSLMAAIPAYAERTKPKEPSEATMSEAELNKYSEEVWSALKDHNLEYSEIKDIVHNFNPTMAEYWDAYDDGIRGVAQSVSIMKEAKKNAVDNYDKYKNIPGIPVSTLAQLQAMVALTSQMVKQYASAYDRLNRIGSSNAQLRLAEDQLTKAIQQMMIGYKTIESNVKTLKKLVELNEASYKAYQDMKDRGMATDNDVLKAQADLISARSTLASLEATRKQLYAQLVTMCGWKADDDITIGEIPDADQATIDAMDPATDLAKASGNNATLISLRQQGRKKNSEEDSVQNAYYRSVEDNLRIKLDTLYAEVVGAQYAYEGAKAGYEGARIQSEALKKQSDSGMLSKAQYIGSQIQVLQKEVALENARNSLKQAVENYTWAVKGFCDIE